MQVSATAKFIRISPKKVRPLLKNLRGRKVVAALSELKYSPTKSGQLLFKLISSALANATNNYNLKPEKLTIKTIVADGGPSYKRYWFRSHGSVDVLLKRTAHLSVTLEDATVTDVKPKVVKTKKTTTVKSDEAKPEAIVPAKDKEQGFEKNDKKVRATKVKKTFITRTTNK